MLKAVPNKNAGFIILLTSIFIFFFFGEIRNLTTLCLLNNNGFSLSSFFSISLSFLWIGAQFPQEKFLSYGRILTLHYYFLLMCILFAFKFLFSWSQILLSSSPTLLKESLRRLGFNKVTGAWTLRSSTSCMISKATAVTDWRRGWVNSWICSFFLFHFASFFFHLQFTVFGLWLGSQP